MLEDIRDDNVGIILTYGLYYVNQVQKPVVRAKDQHIATICSMG